MDDINNLLHAAGAEAVKQLQQLVRTKANATGQLANSISYRVNNGVLQITGAPYLPYVLYGRKPGKGPPRKAIEQWIDEKGIVAELSRQSLAYLIQRKIATEGTTGILSKAESAIPPPAVAAIKTQLKTSFKNSVAKQMRSAFKNK